MASKARKLISDEDLKEVEEYVSQSGVSNIGDLLKSKLDGWKDVPVNIGITGGTGAGKSSFINAIRGLNDDDDMAAAVGVTETTQEPTPYDHPINPQIKFWDLPGIGTPNYPDEETYNEKIKLERFHAFLIFTGNRFRENERQLIKKIAAMEKNFFCIRAKIDMDVQAERRKRSFNENAVLQKIRSSCSSNLAGLLRSEEDIFLISNHYPAKWDFDRLTQAILDALPMHQRESLTMSLGILTSLSTNILKRKVEILKKRLWIAASASAAVAAMPVPGLSIVADLALMTEEICLYRSQLGIPEEGSARFVLLSDTTKIEVKAIWATMVTATQVTKLLAVFAAGQAVEEVARFIPFVGSFVASVLSFTTTYLFLKHCLGKIEETALLVLKEASDNCPID